MNKILSFVGMDLRIIKPYMKSMILLAGLGIFMGIMFKSGETFASYIAVSLMLIMSYPFAITEKNRIDMLYGTLTINKKTVVAGRYMFVALSALVGAVISFIGSVLLTLAFGNPLVIWEQIFMLCLLMTTFVFVTSCQFPIYFKYGYTKGKAASLILLFIIFAVIMLIPMLGEWFNFDISLLGIFSDILQYPALSCIVILLFGFLSLAVSYLISCKLYTKKDI